MTEYPVNIQHDDDGDLTVEVREAGSSERDRASIAWVKRPAWWKMGYPSAVNCSRDHEQPAQRVSSHRKPETP